MSVLRYFANETDANAAQYVYSGIKDQYLPMFLGRNNTPATLVQNSSGSFSIAQSGRSLASSFLPAVGSGGVLTQSPAQVSAGTGAPTTRPTFQIGGYYNIGDRDSGLSGAEFGRLEQNVILATGKSLIQYDVPLGETRSVLGSNVSITNYSTQAPKGTEALKGQATSNAIVYANTVASLQAGAAGKPYYYNPFPKDITIRGMQGIRTVNKRNGSISYKTPSGYYTPKYF